MKFQNRLIYFKKRLLCIIAISTLAISVYLFIDYRGPESIALRDDVAFGLECSRAKDLVVQEYDSSGNLWATRGMIIYRLKNGSNKFERIAHVPTGFTIYWLRNFSIVRKLTLRPECVEMVITSRGDFYAMSAGRLWLMLNGGNRFREIFSMPHYGFGDQGIRNAGILNNNDSTIYLGEYYRNQDKNTVRVFKYIINADSLEVAYTFPAGRIRHVHALQKDPFTGKLWICTGDSDDESMVAWSDNEFRTIHKIGGGNQSWRVCQLVFTEESILWGTDSGSGDHSGIYSWDKQTAELKKLQRIDGAVFYGTQLKNGTIVMSTNREGFWNEKDDKTRLFITLEDFKTISVECGTWNHKKRGYRFKYALLRFQRDQGSDSLAITCLNQKEFPDGELIIISEETLLSTVRTMSKY